MSDLKAYMDSIGIDRYPEIWEENYEEAVRKVDEGLPVLSKEYLCMLHDKYHMFDNNMDHILECARRIRSSKALSLYVALIASISDRLLTEIPKLNIPEAPNENAFEYNAASMFGLLHAVPDSAASYEAHHVPQGMIREALEHFEGLAHGVDNPNLAYMGEYVHAYWFHIGNLAYELPHENIFLIKVFKSKAGELCAFPDGQLIHREGHILGAERYEDPEGSFMADITETPTEWIGYAYDSNGHVSSSTTALSKEDWTPVLTKEDPTILVHIPPKALDPEGVSRSLKDAEAFFREHYPEIDVKAFVCESWLMEPKLSEILKPDSRILSFQRMYHHFDMISDSNDLFYFVFNGNHDIPSLPENTTLERGIKNYFLKGGCLRSGIGYRLIGE